MLQPPTAPPMMTTRAWVGNSDAMRGLLEPLAPLWVADPLARALEVPIGVVAEVEVELRDAALQQPTRRLAPRAGARPGIAAGVRGTRERIPGGPISARAWARRSMTRVTRHPSGRRKVTT